MFMGRLWVGGNVSRTVQLGWGRGTECRSEWDLGSFEERCVNPVQWKLTETIKMILMKILSNGRYGVSIVHLLQPGKASSCGSG